LNSPNASEQGFIDDYLSYLLAQAADAISREFDAELRKHRIRAVEWRALALLSDSDGLSIGEFAELALLKQPTATKLIDRMCAAGLVERRHSAPDHRKALVFITARGRERVGNLLVRARTHELKLLADLADVDAEQIKSILRTLIEHASKIGRPRARRIDAAG